MNPMGHRLHLEPFGLVKVSFFTNMNIKRYAFPTSFCVNFKNQKCIYRKLQYDMQKMYSIFILEKNNL